LFSEPQPGDTLSSISEEYDSSIRELQKMNKLSKNQLLKVGTKLKVPKDDGLPDDPSGARSPDSRLASRDPDSVKVSNDEVSHVVRAGENLTSIAKRYGVTVQALQKANNLSRRTRLKVGARLLIPVDNKKKSSAKRQKSRVHIVKKGENLSHIAGRYNVSVSEIKEKNRLSRSSKLFVGAKILIPSASAKE
jgi:membrane-bound lytic murein transglycosylase D